MPHTSPAADFSDPIWDCVRRRPDEDEAGPSCPGCGAIESGATEHHHSVVRCGGCGGIYTTSPIYLGDSHAIVWPHMAADQVPTEALQYFDFETLGSGGIGRRHGWFDPATKLVHQAG